MNRIRVRPLVAVIAITVAAAPRIVAQATLERRIDSLFAAYTTTTAPGVAVAVVRDGKVFFSKGYGMANLEHRIPITPTTVFDVASVSKQFTGLAVAMLVDQGRIKLGDDIKKYIPELGDVGHVVTIDHLLHHTSGYRDWPGTLALAGWRFDDVISFDQILRFATHQRTLNFAPGSEHMYSNTGYNLLAEMVRRVTGQSFRAWTDEHLFRPLGMTDSHFQDDHTRLIPNRAFGYARQPDGTFRNSTDNLTALGSSSLFSSVTDLAKWVANFDDPKVGGATAMAMMRTPGTLTNGTSIPYAFGISNGQYRGAPTLSHSGGWASFGTFVLHFPRQRFGVIALSNGGGVNTSRASFDIADIVLGTELGPRPTTTVAQSSGAVVVSNDVLDKYTGLYRLSPGRYVRIRRDGRTLKTQATREAEFPMTARSETGFWVDGYNAPMVFHVPPSEPTRLQYRGQIVSKLIEPMTRSALRLAAFVGTYESSELETRYRVEETDRGLVMHHWRHGTIELTRLWGDDFSGSMWFTRSVEFQRDAAGTITGFMVRVDDRSRDIWFIRKSS